MNHLASATLPFPAPNLPPRVGRSAPAPKRNFRIVPVQENPLHNLEELLDGIEDSKELLEYFSIWLNDKIPHDLLAYWNPREERAHIITHARSTERKALLQAAREVMDAPLPRNSYWRKADLFYNIWPGFPVDKCDRLLLIESGERENFEKSTRLLENALRVLAKFWKGPADPKGRITIQP